MKVSCRAWIVTWGLILTTGSVASATPPVRGGASSAPANPTGGASLPGAKTESGTVKKVPVPPPVLSVG